MMVCCEDNDRFDIMGKELEGIKRDVKIEINDLKAVFSETPSRRDLEERYHKVVSHSLSLTAKENGEGSRANDGELFFLGLAACYSKDIDREAIKEITIS